MDLKLSAPGAPRFAYGFWRYGEDEIEPALALIEAARKAGIDHLDTADCYGAGGRFGAAERMLGQARKRAPSLFEGAVIATKAGVEFGAPYNSSPAYLRAACEASLARLGVERIDLFYVHRHDLLAHPAEVAAALDALATEGKIAAVAVSNYTAAQIEALARHLKAPLAAHQVEFSAYCLEPIFDGVFDQAMGKGLAVAAWSPLAGGRLGDGAGSGDDEALARVRARITALAHEKGVAPAAIALAFVLRHPAAPAPILGTKTPARLAECVTAKPDLLTRAQWYSIIEARRGALMP